MQLTKKVLKELFKKSERFLPEVPRANSFLQAKAIRASSSRSYVPESNGIFGTLKQMLVAFEMTTVTEKKQETDAVKTFADLKKSKDAEIMEKVGVVAKEEQEIIDAGHGINEKVAK